MGRRYLEPHIFEGQHHITSCIFTEIDRTDIKIPAPLMCKRSRKAVVIRMEQEELALGTRIKRIPKFCGMCDRFLQHISRIDFIGRSVRPVYITDQARHLALLRAPRKYLKRTQIRIKIHIRVLFP